MCKENDSVCFGIGIIAGVVGGLIAGVLLAPKKGEESCKDVKSAIENLIETQSPNVQEAKRKAIKAIDIVRYKVEDKIKKIANAVKSEKMEKAKQLEEANSDYDI
jgi:gas vesicle protein